MMHLGRGNRLDAYLNLKMEPDVAYKFDRDYMGVKIPFSADQREIKSGHYAVLKMACEISPRVHRVLVTPNPKLITLGLVSGAYILDPVEQGKTISPVVGFRPTKDFNPVDSGVDWVATLMVMDN